MPACIIRPAASRPVCAWKATALLYEYCRTHGIAHEQTGKLIVARDDAEAATLETILAQGRENRVPGLSLLGAGDVRRMEPDVSACSALFSETTGVVDAHGLMASS